MTISTTISRVAYVGDGASTAFMVPFPFFAASELEVLERSIAAGTETSRVLGTHYTVAGGNGEPGTVMAVSAPSSAMEWVIRRKTARTQSTDYTPNDPFPAETHEKALDRLTVIAQELGEESDRSLKFPKTDAAGLMATLPASPARAGRVLAFDGAGAPTISTKMLSALESEAENAATSAASAVAAATNASASAADAATSAGAADASALAAAAPIVAQGGTSARTQAAHFGDVLSVKDFGCVGNGIADDTANFQGALNGAAASRRDLLVPPGTYVLSGVTIPAPTGLRLDKGATLKLKNDANANLLTITASDVAITGQGTIDGNKANQASNGIGIAASTVDRILIDGITVKDTKSYGIRLQDGDDFIVRNIRSTGTVLSAVQVFCTAKSVNRASVSDCVIDRSEDATYSDGCVKLSNNSGGTTFGFVGCRIHGNRVKMHAVPTGADVVLLEIWAGSLLANQGCAITDNVVSGGAIAISLNGCISGVASSNTVVNAYSIGVESADSHESSIVGNTVIGGASQSASFAGISLSGITNASRRATVTGNTVKDATGASAIGIYVGDTSTDCVIADNQVYNHKIYGIEINTGSDGATVTGNIVVSTQAGSIGIVTQNCSNLSIVGNRVATVSNGIQILASSGTRDHIRVVANVAASSGANAVTVTGANLGTDVRIDGIAAGLAIGDYLDYKNLVFHMVGTDDPLAGAMDWPGRGAMYIKRDGGLGLAGYLKDSAAGSAGWRAIALLEDGTTAQRPTPAAPAKGFSYYDSDLGRMIWWDGTAFKDADGLTPKGKDLEGSATYHAPSIATSGTTTTTVTVTGAALGDYAACSFGVSLAGLMATAYVSAADTVTVVLFNPTANAIDLASTTLRVRVRKL